ncbi:MAG TPA: response regulator [Candidatus Omnitrophota bacterium]|nr:response regulator [Candidatus Omnitrophota bacterium]
MVKKKILLIEDSIFFAQMLESHLQEKGFEVIKASTGEAGLQQAREQYPDLILLDLVLPTIPGEVVCKELKKDEQLKAIPVVMLTSKDSEVDRVVGRVIGADLYLPKPFAMNMLLSGIDRLIGTD